MTPNQIIDAYKIVKKIQLYREHPAEWVAKETGLSIYDVRMIMWQMGWSDKKPMRFPSERQMTIK